MDLEAARRALMGAAESLAAAVGRMVAVDSSDDEGIGPRSATAMEEREQQHRGVVGRRRRRRKGKQQQPGAAHSPPRVRSSKSGASLNSYYDAVPEEEGDEFDEDDDDGGEGENVDDDDDDGVLVPRVVGTAEGAAAPQEQAMYREPVAATAFGEDGGEDELKDEEEDAQPQGGAKRASGFGFGWLGFGNGGRGGGGRDSSSSEEEEEDEDGEARQTSSTSRSTSRSPSPSPPPPRYVPGTPLPVLPAEEAPPMSDASPLLSPEDAAALAVAGLPARLRFCGWRLAYSTGRDGTSLSTLYRAAAAAAAGGGSGPVFPGGGGGGMAAAMQEAASSSSASCSSFPGVFSPPRPPVPPSASTAAAAAAASSSSVGTGAGGPSVLLVRDRGGAVFGCFTSEPWGPPRPRYFGNGESFVFSLRPERRLWRWHAARCAVEVPVWALDEEEQDKDRGGGGEEEAGGAGAVVAAGAAAAAAAAAAATSPAASRSTETRMTPRNDFFQLARPTSLALGGGPRFALALDADLSRGRSGGCETFGCAKGLASGGEEFDVGRVELWSLH